MRKPRSKHDDASDSDVGIQSTTDDECNAPDLIDSDSDDDAPRKPCMATMPAAHREKTTAQGIYNACVARPVKPAEVRVNKKAQAAMQDEWDRLRQVRRPDGKLGV